MHKQHTTDYTTAMNDSTSSRLKLLYNLSGIFFFLLGFFLLLSLVSNIYTGVADQAEVIEGYSYIIEAENWGGKLGALWSYHLMNNYFGILSLLLPLLSWVCAFKLWNTKAKGIRLWLFFVHLSVMVFLGSVVAHALQVNLLSEQTQELSFKLGGAYGAKVYEILTSNLGLAFTLLLLLISGGSYVMYIVYFLGKCLMAAFAEAWQLHQQQRSEQTAQQARREFEKTTPPPAKTADTPQSEMPLDSQPSTEKAAENVESPQVLTLDLDEEGELGEDNMEGESYSEQPIEIPLPDTEKPSSFTEQSPKVASPSVLTEQSTVPHNTPREFSERGIDFQVFTPEEENTAGAKTVAEVLAQAPYDPRRDLSHYAFPTIDLLAKHDAHNVEVDMQEQNANKNRIIEVLRNFGVEITGISATIGPTVTLYEIVPAPGVRVSKIKNLEDDIALSLAADGIRIIAPIPGKGTIGIEVPNRRPQIVSMESIINTKKFKETSFELPLALGKTITNEVFMVDLAKMPHMLVAGATGQGKSVGLNAIIASLLYKKHPAELKLVMVDPKKVEFSMYNPLIKHFLAQVPDSDEPVITDTQKVVQTLKSLCQEMDDRYELLKAAHCKNLREYNDKFKTHRLNPELGHRFLPYIVVIIDEYGDLIMTAGKDIELPIARIAQLARAVGMHMVIATQSPRADIITGKIKANFPARMAFRVMGLQESRIILDEKGANSLIGRGDMLIMTGGNTIRVQCAFLDTPEVEAITEFISKQQGYAQPYELPLVAEEAGDSETSYSNNGAAGDTFEEVAYFVVRTQQGSTSKIQRTFSIGFNRAGRLMDQLEEAGIVGPVNGSKPREVYVQDENQLRLILDSLKAQGKKFG